MENNKDLSELASSITEKVTELLEEAQEYLIEKYEEQLMNWYLISRDKAFALHFNLWDKLQPHRDKVLNLKPGDVISFFGDPSPITINTIIFNDPHDYRSSLGNRVTINGLHHFMEDVKILHIIL